MNSKELEKRINDGKEISLNELGKLIIIKQKETKEATRRLILGLDRKLSDEIRIAKEEVVYKVEDVHIKLTTKINNVDAKFTRKTDSEEVKVKIQKLA
ncbi:MAG: hypothetical protein WCG20_00330 [bacterium]